eukprot:362704-Chlamydomonas_euryale.AAC.3
MDGRMDGWTDGWKDGWMDGRMDGWADGWKDGWMEGRMDGWTDGWMGGEGRDCQRGTHVSFACVSKQAVHASGAMQHAPHERRSEAYEGTSASACVNICRLGLTAFPRPGARLPAWRTVASLCAWLPAFARPRRVPSSK